MAARKKSRARNPDPAWRRRVTVYTRSKRVALAEAAKKGITRGVAVKVQGGFTVYQAYEEKPTKKNPARFRDLPIGAEFDFIDPDDMSRNSFFKRVVKTSPRGYVDAEGIKYRVGTIDVKVHNVGTKKNPARKRSLTRVPRALLGQAGRLFEDFTGDKSANVQRIKKPEIPEVLVAIGTIDGILYSTVRDHKVERYIHKFVAKARPTFAVSPDGKQLFMLGGAYNFTERGIVDKTTKR
jgi:hypothetical protein